MNFKDRLVEVFWSCFGQMLTKLGKIEINSKNTILLNLSFLEKFGKVKVNYISKSSDDFGNMKII